MWGIGICTRVRECVRRVVEAARHLAQHAAALPHKALACLVIPAGARREARLPLAAMGLRLEAATLLVPGSSLALKGFYDF